jgi:alkylation response protein AidB-like acyl-CoA dehydrogenase
MEHSERHEVLNAISPEVIEAIHESGLIGMWVPKELGGAELPPRESIEAIAALTYADPATAWITMASALATGTGGAYLEESAVPRIFGDTSRFPVIAGQGTRVQTAKKVDGGFLLTGDWFFGSGIKHADFIHTAAADPESGQAYIFVLENKPEYWDDSSWDVMGLQGTGSIDYHLRDVFVPEDQCYDIFTETAHRGGSIFGIGTIQFALLGHTGFAIGVGRRLLDELLKLAQSGKGRPGQIAGDGAFLEEYARQEAKFRGARAWAMEVWADIEESFENGATECTTRQKTLARLSTNNLTFTSYDVMNFVIKSAATQVIRPGVINHFIRDMIVGSTHVTSSQPVLRDAGRELAGLAPNEHWVFLGLAPDEA